MRQSTGIDFDCLMFEPMNLSQWKERYGGAIRVSCDLRKIRKSKVGLKIADEATKIYSVWYRKGNWRDGEPKPFKVGKTPCLVRIPAINIKDYYILIDGNHRMVAKPCFVVLDYLKMDKSECKYMTDLYNPFWMDVLRK